MITLYVTMTSGVRGPEIEITDEQAEHISSLVSKLTEFWKESRFFGPGLSPNNYIVSWEDKYALRVIPEGLISVWSDGDKEWQGFKDTVGLWKYLEPIGQAALQKWKEDAIENWIDFDEELPGTPE